MKKLLCKEFNNLIELEDFVNDNEIEKEDILEISSYNAKGKVSIICYVLDVTYKKYRKKSIRISSHAIARE